MRIRLRPPHSPETLAEMYANPWASNSIWPDHDLRIKTTIAVADWYTDVRTVADLSAGDSAIVDGLARHDDLDHIYLGDIACGRQNYPHLGPIERTIHEIPPIDLFICSETLEHLDDPDTVLSDIRAKTRHLVVSTPIGETDPDCNAEHYWGWDVDGFGDLLALAGFRKELMVVVGTPPEFVYDFQIWGCS